MDEIEALKEAGLNEREIKIYLVLLREKYATASRLAKLSKLNRTTAYLELDNLLEKGLTNYIIKKSKRYYQPSNPKKIVEILEIKKEKIKRILPKLINLGSPFEKFHIEVYEGKQGLKTLYEEILEETNEVLAFGVTGEVFKVLEFEFPHFLKKYIKKGLKARYLANINSKKLLSDLPKKNIKIKYLPAKYKSEITTIIYKDKIAIQSLKKDQIYLIIIKDKNLNQGYRNYFELMWDK